MSAERAVTTKTYKLSDDGMIFPDEDKPKATEILKQVILDLLGAAIRASGVPRSELTVVTKLVQTQHHDPETSLRESLVRLDVGYIDIFLMHWPNASGEDGRWRSIEESPTFVETYKKMETFVGPECRSIGVYNFSQKKLDVLLKECTIKPVVNLIEVHLYNPNLKLVPYCLEGGIRLVKRGIVPIPHSASRARMDENLRPISLTDHEVEQINNMHKQIGQRRLIDSVPFAWGEVSGKGSVIMGWTVQEMGWEDAAGNVLV
ncbi:hypothetical protein ACJ73_03342 [Blastomyces percursus]|uniref:NADP-dependent oxidoreductase domain-containing protein n=1 Tax=Blastomyces percursus TaxID=1658174 RepID=A0A1J9Q928_9EURO|nr:hypothetical protein ACJ73_03342 [Blastomyces percursus]